MANQTRGRGQEAYSCFELLVLRGLILVWDLHVSADIIKQVDCERVALVQLEAVDLLNHCLRLLHVQREAF